MKPSTWLAAALIAVAACSPDQPDVSTEASRRLQASVAEIRALAGQGHADQLQAKLDELGDQVQRLLTEGELTDEGAARILAAATAVEQQLVLITTTTTATTQPPPPDEEEEDD